MRPRVQSMGGGAVLALVVCLMLMVGGVRPANAADTSASVRVVQGLASVSGVDVYLDNGSSPLLSNFTFGTVSSYMPVTAGSHTVAVTHTGQPVSSAILKDTETFTAGTSYTLSAVGDAKTPASFALTTDDNTVASGRGKMRAYLLSTDVGASTMNASGQPFTPSTVDFKSATDYLTLQPGVYSCNLRAVNSGATAAQKVTLGANQVASVFVVGKLSPGQGESKVQAVVASVPGVPTGLPPTGFAPGSTSSPLATLGPALLVLAALALLLVAGLGGTRRQNER